MTSRGFRNNNPGNIRRDKTKWQGASAEQKDKSFVTFDSPVWGIRAIARILIAYQDKHRCMTVKQHISRWAPPVENDTARYADFVANHMGVSTIEAIDVTQYAVAYPMIEAIIDYENDGTGSPYTKAQMDKALALAGIEPPPKALISTRTGKGSVVTASSVSTAALLDQAKDTFTQLAPYTKWATLALGLIALGSVVYVLWARYDDMRKLQRT